MSFPKINFRCDNSSLSVRHSAASYYQSYNARCQSKHPNIPAQHESLLHLLQPTADSLGGGRVEPPQ
eukprot:scaffold149040_cov62-Cyclotella_meneghiniana.AAC.3